MRAIHNPDCAETELTPEDHLVLIKRIAEKRDRDAFQALFLHFGPRVKAIMQQSGADPALAEDLVQDVMLTVWSKVHLYAAERGTVSTWIYTIARNARIDRFRRRSSRPYQDLDTIEVASEECNGEDALFASQRAGLVALALEELPAEQREIIESAFVRDMSQTEIAEKLSLPLGTVKSRMRLAYTKLKAKLEGVQ
ncbi:sigma-70 family RNA polymerase sigma factor [Roseibium salinum]|uniref:RNA polymerase sigma factor n=1 Tax=Roseibium salinum TaxID=1604349 RepID=A0ABT3QWP0_9HYPH|nr:sigma-70 family RNA polymerase sigma factor [Roseibium sp. DSM 29163]MCX2721354.1 sigma-70 family RNA polymerase sigma factor [Roseibium sp. DSM 29163]